MLKHSLALRLSKTVGEIDDIPYQEFIDWLAFFDLTKRD